jgi:hypothetical protein
MCFSCCEQVFTGNSWERDLKRAEREKIKPQLISCLSGFVGCKPLMRNLGEIARNAVGLWKLSAGEGCAILTFSLTSCIELGLSAKLTVIGFVCSFSNISAINIAHPMVEMMNAIIQKIRSIHGREVSPMY